MKNPCGLLYYWPELLHCVLCVNTLCSLWFIITPVFEDLPQGALSTHKAHKNSIKKAALHQHRFFILNFDF
jgi:hypothetical protein